MSQPLLPKDYDTFLQSLKVRIRQSQVRAALSVNRELVLLYWSIGQEILHRQHTQGWGTKVIDRLAKDLQREFPDLQGFSSRNLKYMRALAEAYPDRNLVQQLVAQIPWGHNLRILDTVKDPALSRCTTKELYNWLESRLSKTFNHIRSFLGIVHEYRFRGNLLKLMNVVDTFAQGLHQFLLGDRKFVDGNSLTQKAETIARQGFYELLRVAQLTLKGLGEGSR